MRRRRWWWRWWKCRWWRWWECRWRWRWKCRWRWRWECRWRRWCGETLPVILVLSLTAPARGASAASLIQSTCVGAGPAAVLPLTCCGPALCAYACHRDHDRDHDRDRWRAVAFHHRRRFSSVLVGSVVSRRRDACASNCRRPCVPRSMLVTAQQMFHPGRRGIFFCKCIGGKVPNFSAMAGVALGGSVAHQRGSL